MQAGTGMAWGRIVCWYIVYNHHAPGAYVCVLLCSPDVPSAAVAVKGWSSSRLLSAT